MPDLLIRDVPDDVVAAIDAKAKRLGLSRAEYLRRQMLQAGATSTDPVTVEDLQRVAERFADLTDPDVMRAAWE
ncbi:MAG: ribbon-helix-helix protein, CopG family [Actinobacteria bacterium]|nr:ribbon-helix-helix protein, CopG family [Actinomycetota bacterium]